MHFSQGLAAVVVLGLCYSPPINAQATTTAVCTTDTWTSNQEGTSPCVVASALQGACNAGKWTIDPLSAGSQYSGPLVGQSNKCQCSTVTFSMVAACGACQAGSVASWNAWRTNCSQSDVSVGSFPVGIPAGITVPAWAFLNVTTTGVWDPTAALNTHNSGANDSSAVASATGSGSNNNPSSTSNSSTSSSSSKSNAGAIAGGVVGGVLAIALVGIGAFIFIRRRRRALVTPASAQFNNNSSNNNNNTRGRGEKVDLTGQSFGGLVTPALPMQSEPPRLYDPSDPTTFPSSPTPSLPGYTNAASPAPSAPYSQTSGPFSTVSGPLSPLSYGQPGGHGSQGHLHQISHTTNANHGGYTGVPEI